MLYTSTIAAIATPSGRGGIGIVKLSGKKAVAIAEAIFRRAARRSPGANKAERDKPFKFDSHHLYYGHIFDPESNKILDEVLLTVMLSPNSYTREDVVEVNVHSGPVVLSEILSLAIKLGARLAEPGEFTKRAYLNGRIDLTQAEAVIDIINAKTIKSLELATSQVKGELKTRIETNRNCLVDLLTDVEAAIDFPEDVDDCLYNAKAVILLEKRILADLRALIQNYRSSHVLRDGLKMIVVGKPNVGKSSLVNRLIMKDRVIVTEIPGTTRDLIDEAVIIHGIPVIITDTAGLHRASDPIEAMGIEKTLERLETSDLVLFMVDASCVLSEIDSMIYDKIKEKEHILVLNKMDLVCNGFEPDLPESLEKTMSSRISALYNEGINELKEKIKEKIIDEGRFNSENIVVPNIRHTLSLEKSANSVKDAISGLKGSLPAEIVAIDLREAISILGEIIGITAKEDVIENIFSRFCVGK